MRARSSKAEASSDSEMIWILILQEAEGKEGEWVVGEVEKILVRKIIPSNKILSPMAEALIQTDQWREAAMGVDTTRTPSREEGEVQVVALILTGMKISSTLIKIGDKILTRIIMTRRTKIENSIMDLEEVVE